MSTDTVFATKIESVPEKPIVGKNDSTQSFVDVEVPYNDYEQAKGLPYVADYFKLGDTWNDSEGGFPNEIESLRSYISEKIESGEIANSVTAVKDLIKNMEKLNNLSNEERAVVKIEILANYVDFMRKNDSVKKNLRRYANTQ